MPGTRNRNNLPKREATAAPQPGRVSRLASRSFKALRSHPRRGAGAGVLLLAMIAGIVYLVWPAPSHGYQPADRTRTYTDYTACLLTDSTGITGTAAPVWTGMQAASRTTREQVSYLTMQGDDTAANADTYINTLALRGCDIIVAAGVLPDQGVADRAGAYPKLRFITVAAAASAGPSATASTGSTATAAPIPNPANVTTLTGTSAADTSAAVQTALIRADPAGSGTAAPTST